MKQDISKKEDSREVSLKEIKSILSKTIVQDDISKIILFLGTLLTYTEEDQVNIAFKAESSTGKSYIVREVLEYFPQEDITFIAYTSPTAFYHDEGEFYDEHGEKIDLSQEPGSNASRAQKKLWKERLRKSVTVINWEKKIKVFLDQPHDQFLQRLRTVLSHDMKDLVYKITDKTGKFGLKTKTVHVRGYATVLFCSAKMNMEDQDRTRLFLLSPEITNEKLESALELMSKNLGNRDEYKKDLEADKERQWLQQRIRQIKQAKIRNIIIPDTKQVCYKFRKQHKHLAPRVQRDYPRLLALIKAHALLNCFTRKQGPNDSIIANETDINAGFEWYAKILPSNELGLAPETFNFYVKIFQGEIKGLTKDDIMRKHYVIYHRTFNLRRLERDVLPALKSAGLIIEQSDTFDRRIKRYIPLKGGVILSPEIDDYKDLNEHQLDEEKMTPSSAKCCPHLNTH